MRDISSNMASIAQADPNNLKQYSSGRAKSSYWLSEEDIMVAVKPLSQHPDVYKPNPGLGIPVISQSQSNEIGQLQEDFRRSNQKLFFVFEQVETDSGGHWQLHSWQKDENDSIIKNTYDPKADGTCGDRAIAKAYQIAKPIIGDIAGTPVDLDLFNDCHDCLDTEPSQNKKKVREQTITLIRGPSDSQHRSESHYSDYIKQHGLFGLKGESEQTQHDYNEVKGLSKILPDIIEEDGYTNNKDAWVDDQFAQFKSFESDDSQDADESNNGQSIKPK